MNWEWYMSKKEDNILKEIIIKESNTLALSLRNKALHPFETKLLMWIYYQFQVQKPKGNSVIFSIKEFFTFFEIKSKNAYKFVKRYCVSISSLSYLLYDDKKEELLFSSLTPQIGYKKGLVYVTFGDIARQHLSNLSKNYITVGLNILKEIKNPRFLRMYEWLKAKIFDGYCRSETISLPALYELLIIKENTYSLFKDFKQRILNPILKELCKTDLEVEVEYIRTGRKITHLRFTCANNREMIEQNNSKKYCSSCKIRSVILKTSDKGDFWGCENYPRCKYKVTIKDIKQDKSLNNKKNVIQDNYLQNAFAEIVNSKKDFEEDYLTTNYKKFDKFIHGIKKNTFNIIFGKTSAGKTAFVLNLMMRLRKKNKPIRAVFYSLEMNKYDVDRRLLSIVSHVALDKIEKEQQKVQDALKNKNNLITVDDEKQSDLESLIKKIKQNHQQQPIDLVIIDYLQILSSKNTQNQYEKVSQAARALQKLSTDLKITIIAISQINRSGDRKLYLELHDIQDSSVIAQSADLVIALQRNYGIENGIKCNILKNRNGSSMSLLFNFNRQNMVFSE